MTTIYVTDKEKLPKREESDHYPTELDLVKQALKNWVLAMQERPVDSILDIGAGSGRWGQQARLLTNAQKLVGVDIRELHQPEAFTHWITEDFLNWSKPFARNQESLNQEHWDGQPFDLIVSNPPYKFAGEILETIFERGMLNKHGSIVMLLRLAFQASISRYESLWYDHPPVKVGVCSRRPSFYDRSTNGTDYGVFYWKQGEGTPRCWETFLLLHDRDPLPPPEYIEVPFPIREKYFMRDIDLTRV